MKLRSHKGFIKAVCILNAVALQFNTFADWWDYAKQVASEQWEETKQAASVQWEETKQAASEKWEETKQAASVKWEETKQAASVKWEETKQAASEKWEETKQVTSRKWDKTKQSASAKWKEAKRAASEKWNETKQVTSKKWDKTKQAASEKWDETKQAASEKWEETKQVTSKKWDKTKQWFSENKEEIMSTFVTAATVAIAIYAGKEIHDLKSSDKSKSSSGYIYRDSHSTEGAYKPFSAGQKADILQQNRERNGGVLRSDYSGKILEEPRRYTKGYTPSPNEAQIDHIKPRSRGGWNSAENAQVLSREENLKKSDK